ncbi:MAG: 3-phosphoshikimate 1-carboxyvinyltransferase, partial [Lachnospiraceae bacterium]|nr:3-phosphoshikimate 1-carboxyvinyltransferase [Candidatus Minthocola equi]
MKAVFSRQKLKGIAKVPSSKSYMMRAIVIALLSGKSYRINNPLESADTISALYAAEAFGAHVEREGGAWILTGPAELKQPEKPVDMGNSGTALYFFASVAALLPGKTIFTGDAQTR